jgi:flagellin-like hook-associated protein FlgL
MAINDVSLTAGMRSNLVSLQGTVDLLNRTQDRLSTGKKVNSALDNPLNYFTAKALNSRASDLSAYKDAMSEAVQTIKAANAGISAIEGLIAQAKAVAASAKGTASGVSGTYAGEQISMTGVTSGTVITYGGVTLTASNCSVTASASFCAATATASWFVGNGGTEAATNLAAVVTLMGTSCTGASCNITAGTPSGSTLNLISTAANITAGTVTISGTGSTAFTETTLAAGATDRANYYSQYTTIRTQIDLVATDSGYKGINFLATGNSLDVFFGATSTDKITVNGFDGSSASLTTSVEWALNSNIDTDIASMTATEATLKSQSSTLSSGLSIINTRQDWVKGMVNTLTEGADKLTLADMNEEGANMLMLQTRQTLGTTALSLSAQAAQSVLRLFA